MCLLEIHLAAQSRRCSSACLVAMVNVPNPNVVFELVHLADVPYTQGMGGKRACKWQRALREECIAEDMSSKDITRDPDYDWRQLLRSADEGFAAHIIGQGIVQVLFVISETERDPNYSNIDGRGRHFFEFRRADDSAMRLHYHKGGKHDEPTYVGPPGAVAHPAVPHGGAAQPAGPGGGAPVIFTWEHLTVAARSRQVVGRSEASSGLQTLLHWHHGQTAPGAVDITDGRACDWPRWLAHIEGAREAVRDGVHKVYAVRWNEGWAPEAVFCYGDNTYGTLVPYMARYTGAWHDTRFTWHRDGNWQTEELLSAAPVADRSWLVLRGELRYS